MSIVWLQPLPLKIQVWNGCKGVEMEIADHHQAWDDDSIPITFPFNGGPDGAFTLPQCHAASGVMAALDG